MSCAVVEGHNFHVRSGDSGTVENDAGIVLVWKAGTPPEPVNLTGSVVRVEVDGALNAGLLIDRSSEDGGVSVTPLSGAITVPLSSADTRLLVTAIRMRGNGLRYRVLREVGGARRTILSGLICEAAIVNGCC